MSSTRTVDVGRSAECAVRIDHPTVSARHARLTWRPNGRIHVFDLGSSNGTFLVRGDRRVRVRQREVEPTALLVFGSHRLRADEAFRIGGAALAQTPRAASRPPSPVREGRRVRCAVCGGVKVDGQPCPACNLVTGR